jgi:hypothetical protein
MIEPLTPRPFPAVGRCIYCGTTERPLSKEHIVPYALGGNLILPKASCDECADKTKLVEQICSRQMFGPWRLKMNAPTRHPAQRPSALVLEIERMSGTVERVRVQTEEHPSTLMMVTWGPPRLLSSTPGDAMVFMHIPEPSIIPRLFCDLDAREVRLPEFDQLQFARLLAKIGYASGVARRYIPINPDDDLPRFICGRTTEYLHRIGGIVSDLHKPTTRDVLHRIHFYKARANESVYSVVGIRLFAPFGAPLYSVVLGRIGS